MAATTTTAAGATATTWAQTTISKKRRSQRNCFGGGGDNGGGGIGNSDGKNNGDGKLGQIIAEPHIVVDQFTLNVSVLSSGVMFYVYTSEANWQYLAEVGKFIVMKVRR